MQDPGPYSLKGKRPGFFVSRVPRIGAITMTGCMRCGDKFQHNYLVTVFSMIKEKRERLIVCLKCKDILKKKEEKAGAGHGL